MNIRMLSRACQIDKEISKKEKRQMKEETEETVEKARKAIRLVADKLKESYNPEKIIWIRRIF